jgi:outer membrane murein-binding lipoprotein Lpp
MKKIALSLLAFAMLLAAFSFPRALAHEEIVGGDVRIVGGWTNEPPYVNQINGIELNITRISNGQPINNALAQVDVSMRKGGETKPLEFQPTEEAGHYVAEILPTQTGQYAIAFQGTIAGAAFNSGGGVSDEVLEQLQTVITDLTAQVDQATTASEKAQQAAQAATESAAEQKVAADRAYLFGMVGVGVGVAGIIIGVVALSRGKEARALA